MEFLRELQEDMGETPQALRDRPVLEPRLRYFEAIFYDLSTDRGYTASGAPMAIPVSSILAYCDMFYVENLTERETLFHMVKTMDRAFVKELSEKIRRESERGKMNSNTVT